MKDAKIFDKSESRFTMLNGSSEKNLLKQPEKSRQSLLQSLQIQDGYEQEPGFLRSTLFTGDGDDLSFDGNRKKKIEKVHLDGGLDEFVRVPQSI